MLRHARQMSILLAGLLLVILTPAAHAAGEYEVRLLSTDGPNWNAYGRGPFLKHPMKVATGNGVFTTGDYGAWRVSVPSEGANIIGGTISMTIATPDANVFARIMSGTGGASTAYYDGDGTGTVTRNLTGTSDWVQVDLRAAGPVHTYSPSTNHATITGVHLVLRDGVAPALQVTGMPAPTTWHSAGACIPVSFRLTDQGGGLRSGSIVRVATGTQVSGWTAPMSQSTRPGPAEFAYGDCLGPGTRGHGDNEYVATATDVGGHTRQVRFWLRADHVAPRIGGGPREGERYTVPNPAFSFQVGDEGAGVAAISASLDGTPVRTRSEGADLVLETGKLGVGEHTIALHVTDGAGNATALQRRVAVADVTPPVLTLNSPSASGESTAWLSVRASDDSTGVAAASWMATLNGENVALEGDATKASVMLGPLAPGTHRIVVRVADIAGNVATLEHAYTVLAAAVASMPNVGSSTGLWITEAPTAPVGFGLATGVSTYLARNGRPMRGQRVEVRRDGATIGAATTGDDGQARVEFVAGLPGPYQAVVVGVPIDPVDIALRIAPRIVLASTATTPRVGRRIALTGRVLPGLRGRKVGVEARIGGVWYPVRRSAPVGADGRFRTWVVASAPGTIWVRVRMQSGGAWTGAVSNQRELRVRVPITTPARPVGAGRGRA